MIRAAIDIGSNSVILTVAKIADGRLEEILFEEQQITGLGKGLDLTGKLSEESVKATLNALHRFKEVLGPYAIGKENTFITATEAVRKASNGEAFRELVKERFDLEVTIIDPVTEANLAVAGILCGQLPQEDYLLIIDMGGASTEFVGWNQRLNKGEFKFSLPIGSMRATDYLKEDAFDENFMSAYQNAFGDSTAKLDEFLKSKKPQVVGMAGSFLALAQVLNNKPHGEWLNKFTLQQNDLYYWHREKMDWSQDHWLRAYPFIGDRSKTIQGAMVLALKILEKFSIDSMRLTTLGLRHGLLILGGPP